MSIPKDFVIRSCKAREVLDSRGNPTIEVEVSTANSSGRAIVPSGASTGAYEAHELRDKTKRFHGKGVMKAVKNVNTKISSLIKGMDSRAQFDIDEAMIKLDKSKNKARLGANAILGVSMACARAAAASAKLPLYQHLRSLFKKIHPTDRDFTIPIPFCNIINGGKHAGNELQMQEFMIVPVKFSSFARSAQAVSETYQTLKGIIEKKFGKNAINVGDEGGFAPPIANAKQALTLIKKAIKDSGYEGKMKIAIDPAASEFYNKGIYSLKRQFNAKMLKKHYMDLIKVFDIISLEDPFDQDDFDAFSDLTKSATIQIVGDDLTVTNPARIAYAVENKLCNALLLKVNQIGSLSESMYAAKMSFENGWNVMVSHRSGETEDTFIADLSVALGCGQIKIGAPCRSDRTSKYNQILRIEEELGKDAKYAKFKGF